VDVFCSFYVPHITFLAEMITYRPTYFPTKQKTKYRFRSVAMLFYVEKQ